MPLFQPDHVRERWKDPRVNPWLRQVVLIAEAIYREYGTRPRIMRILDNVHPFASGHACELAAGGLPLGSNRFEHNVTLYPEWIAKRLSYLYPYGDGDFETATYLPDSHRILIRVPPRGYRFDSLVLADWSKWGATPGRVYHPCRVDV